MDPLQSPLPEEENELFEHHRFVAAKGQEPLRVDKFLMNFINSPAPLSIAFQNSHLK